MRGRTHRIWAYLCRKHRINSRLGSKFSVQCLIPVYVFALSFDIPASCSRYTGYGMNRIGRTSCCIDLTPPFSPTELTEGSFPLHTLSPKQTGQVAPPGPKLLPSWDQRRADHSQSKQHNRLVSRLVWIFHYIEIYCKRNSLQQTPLFRKGSLWVEGSQKPTSSILRVVSGEKERNQDIIGPLIRCHCLSI